jgi:hypothetical protein
VVEHDIADGLADRLAAARQRALAQVQGTGPRASPDVPQAGGQQWRLIRSKAWSSRLPPTP